MEEGPAPVGLLEKSRVRERLSRHGGSECGEVPVKPGGILEMKTGSFLSWIGWRKWYGKAKAEDDFYVFRTQATSDNQFLGKETDWWGGDSRGRRGQVLR